MSDRHSPTPWVFTSGEQDIHDIRALDGHVVLVLDYHADPMDEPNGKRILASVNACAELAHPDRLGVALLLIREAYTSGGPDFPAAALATNLAIALGIDPNLDPQRDDGLPCSPSQDSIGRVLTSKRH